MNEKTYYLLLWILSIIGSFAVIPFVQHVALFLGNQPIELTPLIIFATIFESMILNALFIFLGTKFSKKLDIKFLLLNKHIHYVQDILRPGVISGIVCALLMLIADRLIPGLTLTLYSLGTNTPPLIGLLALIEVIKQQIFLNLFCLSGIALLLKTFFKSAKMSLLMWVSIIGVSLLFGIAHIPTFVQEITPFTPILIFRILLLNTISGTTFGLLFWKKGFEVAIVSHFTVDFILYVILPIVALR
jgi:hypothetical protein